ncbi:MAG: electron transfer flavoprotein subunit beta/FixA family protein [Anaerolineae bacterium]|nr:electron transfer flavoprotein subunit beta/FixA family protein [Anaerolineae bacterium]
MPSKQGYKLVVLVKQVPDTHNVTSDAMTKDGTMNRAVLPAIFNPEDLNALEMALQFKERYGGEVTVLTMGPPKAAEVLRESLYRGADQVVLITDKKFAGADTLATSYTLKSAVEKLGAFDLIFCGRQAIDGDTAQVGPQTAEKLGIPQITYAESIVELSGNDIVVQRALDRGMEMVKCAMPCLLTVVASANRPRPASARKHIAYKLAATPFEYQDVLQKWPEFESIEALEVHLAERNLQIPVWTAADLDVEEDKLGLEGSPTQVYKINFVVLEAKESKEVSPDHAGVEALVQELIQEYIVG